MISLLIYFLVGIIASLLGSMAGLGGGFLAIPSLYYLGVQLQYVVGTSKFMVFVNSVVSTYRYSRKMKFPVKLYVSVVAPMILTAYLGAYLVVVLPSKILVLVIGVILLAGSIRMIISTRSSSSTRDTKPMNNRMYILGVFSGSVAGIVAGISGLGGGIVNVPVFIYLLGLDPHLAVSLSMACILPSALSSVVRHVIDNVVDWNIAVPLSIGAIIGGWIGPRIALGLKKETLRRIIGLIIAIATTRIIVEAIIGLTS